VLNVAKQFRRKPIHCTLQQRKHITAVAAGSASIDRSSGRSFDPQPMAGIDFRRQTFLPFTAATAVPGGDRRVFASFHFAAAREGVSPKLARVFAAPQQSVKIS
jgi:hypothetical protein